VSARAIHTLADVAGDAHPVVQLVLRRLADDPRLRTEAGRVEAARGLVAAASVGVGSELEHDLLEGTS
jgi:hypothetical protein